jgi:subfamily B ATP-binding cassette protein MsbA
VNALKIVGFPKTSIAALLAYHLFGTIFESFGLSLLLPVFQLIESGKKATELAAHSRFWHVLNEAYASVGLELTIPALLVTSFVAIVMRQVFVYYRLIYVAHVRQSLIRKLREREFGSFVKARLDYVETEGLGSIINDFTIETQGAVECAMATIAIAGYSIVCFVYVSMLVALSVPMTIAAVVVIGIAALPVAWMMREGRLVGRELVEANSTLLAFLSERIRAIRLIRLSGTAGPEMQDMGRRTERQYNRYMRGFVLQSRTTVFMEPIIVAAGFVFLYLGVAVFGLSFGEIGLFLLVIMRIAPAVKEILTVRFAVANRQGSVERVCRRLQGLIEAEEAKTGTKVFKTLGREIAFENVSFRYPGQTVPVLSDVSMHIPCGQITALVGPSGSGKSTLVDLLPRLRVPSSGRILFDGIPAGDFDLESLRDAVSYTPQSPQIFNVAMWEHISYGQPGADRRAIEDAARLAGAHNFIVALPDGYDTKLGEGGVRLSGGQRQRLDLARALLPRAPLLILDEPTSQLDADSEHAFREALLRIRAKTDITLVVIAHRLSTISVADQIVVLRNGRVEQAGSHAILLRKGGWYADAFRKQQEGGRNDVVIDASITSAS